MSSSAKASESAVRSQVRGSSALLTGRALGTGLEFAAQVIAVRSLTQGEFGAFAYALSIVIFLQAISKFGLPDAVSRYIPIEKARDQPGRVLGIVVMSASFVVTSGLAIVIAVWLLSPLLSGRVLEAGTLSLLLVLSLQIPLESLCYVLTGVFASFKNPRAIVLRGSVLAPVLKLTATIALSWTGASALFLAWGYVAGSLLGTILYCWLSVRMLRKDGLTAKSVRADLQMPVRDVFPFASTMLLTSMLWILIDTADALLLGYFKGADAVAYLRAVSPIARVNHLITASFAVLFTPVAASYFARQNREGMQQLYIRTATWTAVLSFPAFLLAFVFAEQLVVALYKEPYRASAPILMVLAFGWFVQAVTGFNGLTLKVYGRLRYAIAIDLAACALNVAVNLFCIPRWGGLGAALGTTITLLMHNALKQGGMHRLTGINLYDQHYLRALATVGILTLCTAVLNLILSVNIVGALVLTATASAMLLYSSRGGLEIDEMFPELLRFALLRRMLARADVPS